MTREEYEEIGNAYEMAYQDYSSMMRRTIPEAWRVEAAVKELEELRLLMKQYEDEHPEECRNLAHDTEQADQPKQPDEEFLKDLEAMETSDVGSSQRPDPAECDVEMEGATNLNHEHAPSRPYRWTEEGRVHVRHEPPCPTSRPGP